MPEQTMPTFTGDDIPKQQKQWRASNPATPPTSPFSGGDWNTTPAIPGPTVPVPNNDINRTQSNPFSQPPIATQQYATQHTYTPAKGVWDSYASDPLKLELLRRAYMQGQE
jgi:hypothetical protein